MPRYSNIYRNHSALGTAGGAVRLEQMRVAGKCNFGKLWSAEEEDLLRKHYPDYQQLRRLLPHRTHDAIQHRCYEVLEHRKRRYDWSENDAALLRKRWKNSSQSELRRLFPSRSYKAIKNHAHAIKTYKGRPPFVITGDCVLDAIRLRCRKLGITLRDLDHYLKTPKVFEFSGCRHSIHNIKERHRIRAIGLLDGSVTGGQIVWR